MEYCVVTAEIGSVHSPDVSKAVEELCERVSTLISEGWEPLGGVATVQAGAQIHLLQAMTRD